MDEFIYVSILVIISTMASIISYMVIDFNQSIKRANKVDYKKVYGNNDIS